MDQQTIDPADAAQESVRKIKAIRTTRQLAYSRLVVRIAGGEEVETSEIMQILADDERSTDELLVHVERQQLRASAMAGLGEARDMGARIASAAIARDNAVHGVLVAKRECEARLKYVEQLVADAEVELAKVVLDRKHAIEEAQKRLDAVIRAEVADHRPATVIGDATVFTGSVARVG